MSLTAANDAPFEDETDVVADVVIVGAGPTGLMSALLLANRGHDVAVIEKWPEPYARPRAVGINHESLRGLQVAGIVDDVRPDIYFTPDGSRRSEMRSAAGEVLAVRIDLGTSISGWPERATFCQPLFERTLNELALAHPRIRLLRGWNVTGVTENGEAATAHAERWPTGDVGALRVTGSFVVGCDGANSAVRTGALADIVDLDFAHDWLVVDVVVAEGRVFNPYMGQIFGPPRPITTVNGGPGNRRRWEFMRLPTESVAELNLSETAWRLLEPFDVHPGNATLERHAVYTFQGRWSSTWRSGRSVLAGDAAHLMPVFLGEGFNSGVRDALALTWRLDLILRGVASDALLDSYSLERLGHVRQVIEQAVEVGKMICTIDPDAALARDARLRSIADGRTAGFKPQEWRLGVGLWDESDPRAGYLGVQGRVSLDGKVGLFDDLIDHDGFVLLSPTDDPRRFLSPPVREAWERIGGFTAHVGVGSSIVDVDGVYADWFAARGVELALFRPDFYVYGTAASPTDADPVVSRLLHHLGVGFSDVEPQEV